MSRKAVTEAGAVVLMLGVLAHPARAQPIELADAQMDNVTAGAFTVTTDPTTGAITLGGSYNGAPVSLTSTDGGRNFTSTTGSWTTQVLYISTTQGSAVGILANGNQYWDGESPLPPAYILKPDRVIIACCGKQPSAPQASAQPSAPQASAQPSAPQASAPQPSRPSALDTAKKGAADIQIAAKEAQNAAFKCVNMCTPILTPPSLTDQLGGGSGPSTFSPALSAVAQSIATRPQINGTATLSKLP